MRVRATFIFDHETIVEKFDMHTCSLCGVTYGANVMHSCQYQYPPNYQSPVVYPALQSAQWPQSLSPIPASLHDNPLFLALLRRVERLEEKLSGQDV